MCVDVYIYSACVRGPSPPVKKVELMCPEEEEEEERGGREGRDGEQLAPKEKIN